MVPRLHRSIHPMLAATLLLAVPGWARETNGHELINGTKRGDPHLAAGAVTDTAANSKSLAAMQADFTAARQRMTPEPAEHDSALGLVTKPNPTQTAQQATATDPNAGRLSALQADFSAARRRLAAKTAERESREDPDNAPALLPSLAAKNPPRKGSAVAVLLPASRENLAHPLVTVRRVLCGISLARVSFAAAMDRASYSTQP